jgi:hypothetical protein
MGEETRELVLLKECVPWGERVLGEEWVPVGDLVGERDLTDDCSS